MGKITTDKIAGAAKQAKEEPQRSHDQHRRRHPRFNRASSDYPGEKLDVMASSHVLHRTMSTFAMEPKGTMTEIAGDLFPQSGDLFPQGGSYNG